MLTIGRSEEVGIAIVDGDLIHGISGDPESNHITPFGKGGFFVGWTIAFFCWRASNGESPKFKGFIDYELKSGAKGTCRASLVGFGFDAMDRCTFWRPSLDSECNLVKSIDEDLKENNIDKQNDLEFSFVSDFSENPFVKIEQVLFETKNVIVFTAFVGGDLREITSQKVNIVIREIDYKEKAKQAQLDHMLKTFTSGDMKNLEALVYNNSHIIKRGLQSLIDAGYEIHLTCDPSS